MQWKQVPLKRLALLGLPALPHPFVCLHGFREEPRGNSDSLILTKTQGEKRWLGAFFSF